MEVTGAGSEEQKKKIDQLEAQLAEISAKLNDLLASTSGSMTEENQNG